MTANNAPEKTVEIESPAADNSAAKPKKWTKGKLAGVFGRVAVGGFAAFMIKGGVTMGIAAMGMSTVLPATIMTVTTLAVGALAVGAIFTTFKAARDYRAQKDAMSPESKGFMKFMMNKDNRANPETNYLKEFLWTSGLSFVGAGIFELINFGEALESGKELLFGGDGAEATAPDSTGVDSADNVDNENNSDTSNEDGVDNETAEGTAPASTPDNGGADTSTAETPDSAQPSDEFKEAFEGLEDDLAGDNGTSAEGTLTTGSGDVENTTADNTGSENTENASGQNTDGSNENPQDSYPIVSVTDTDPITIEIDHETLHDLVSEIEITDSANGDVNISIAETSGSADGTSIEVSQSQSGGGHQSQSISISTDNGHTPSVQEGISLELENEIVTEITDTSAGEIVVETQPTQPQTVPAQPVSAVTAEPIVAAPTVAAPISIEAPENFAWTNPEGEWSIVGADDVLDPGEEIEFAKEIDGRVNNFVIANDGNASVPLSQAFEQAQPVADRAFAVIEQTQSGGGTQTQQVSISTNNARINLGR